MSGTHLDWISWGLATSLKQTLRQVVWWCNNTDRLKGLQSCRACCFQPHSRSDARRDYVWSFWGVPWPADMAVVSQNASTWDSLPILCQSGTTRELPGHRAWSWPKHGVTERLWRWLLIWGLEHHRTFISDGMGTTTIWLAIACMRTCHLIYIDTILVGHQLNLWIIDTVAFVCWELFPTKNG